MAELVVLFLLLPLAAASGWYLARRQSARRNRKRASALSSNYFRGLNYLLNEQPDKAIEVFLKLVEVNPETVETHLALGSLFRRRGEMDKAIRFHKHIITRPGLTDEQRAQALMELGEDYMQAGLLDRAEYLFSDLLDHDDSHIRPVRQLLDIYQQEKDWEKAIEQARRLRHVEGEKSAALIASFHCELARQALDADDVEGARRSLRQARRYDPGNPRAHLIQAELAARDHEWLDAAEHYRQACELDPDCLSFAFDDVVESHRRADRMSELEEWLEALVERTPMTTAILALARMKAVADPREAVAFLLTHLSRRPTVRGLDYLIDLVYRQGASLDEVGPELIQDILQRLLEGQPRYRCEHCGFSGSAWHWLCPGCRRWNTTRAITGVLGE
ncbi:MAG: lipopolysaccharide assembly protein LapB [Gammaproteobacteria bacterium]|jgi:lipopolysaccharide biosynthesis regulator YciM|nr:lipopolysaccharide assembly protein LapB [Gammaproteobacteria bacterium]